MFRSFRQRCLSICVVSITAGAGLWTFPGRAQAPAPDDLSSGAPSAGLYINADGAPVAAFMRSASRTLDVEIYEMTDREVQDAIRLALASHVRVRIIKEPRPLGDGCNLFAPQVSTDNPLCATQKSFVAEVRAAGATFVPFNKVSLCGVVGKSCFEHGKMILVDGRRALISTGNFNASNLCDLKENPETCNRDYSVISEDPVVVGALSSIFESDLRGQRYDVGALLTAQARTRLTVSPLSKAPLMAFIRSAKSTLDVENQYLKDKDLNQALLDAAAAGVKVRVTISSLCGFSQPVGTALANDRAVYEAFDRAGIETRAFTRQSRVKGRNGYMHAKVLLVDGRIAWIGSVNGSGESLDQNREFGLFFSNPAWVAKLSSQVARDHLDQGNESWQESLQCLKDGHGPIHPRP